MTLHRPESLNDGVVLGGLAALGVLAWLLCHPYQGFFHDANLYALQALAQLDPDALSHDVFLSHGSQDRFTLFSPLYAGVITLLGLDRAAALLTLLSQAGLCGGRGCSRAHACLVGPRHSVCYCWWRCQANMARCGYSHASNRF